MNMPKPALPLYLFLALAGTADADLRGPDAIGLPSDQSLLFLQGHAPGDWLDRQKWAPGFEPDSAGRVRLAYTRPPEHQADSCCPEGSLSGAFQTRAKGSFWGAYLDVDRLGARESKALEREDKALRLGGEAGVWLNTQGRFLKGARLAFGSDRALDEATTTTRTGDFASIHDFTKHRQDWRAVSTAILLSPGSHRHLRLSSSLSERRVMVDSGNEVRYDSEAFRRFNSSESNSHSTSSNHFGGELDYLISLKGGSIFDLRAKALLKDGHGTGNRVLGDSARFETGASWLHAFAYGKLEYQIAPTADFWLEFFNSTDRQDSYLGFLKPLDEDRSRKTVSLRAPQRVVFNLGENLKLHSSYGVSLVYWTEKDERAARSGVSATGLDFDVDLGPLTLSYGYAGRLGVAFTPTGRLNSPGGIVEVFLLAR